MYWGVKWIDMWGFVGWVRIVSLRLYEIRGLCIGVVVITGRDLCGVEVRGGMGGGPWSPLA